MATLPYTQLSADVSAAPQLEPAAMALVAEHGFKSVINNRPDLEGGPTQPTSAAIEAAAQTAGLAYAHLPVQPTSQTEEQIAQFGELIRSMPKPILIFCRSGTRSANLFYAATQRG